MSVLFIVGVGRSGTSLLQSMLASHPCIAMLPETGFLRRHGSKTIQNLDELDVLRQSDPRLQRFDTDCWYRAIRRLRNSTEYEQKETISNSLVYKELSSVSIASCQAEKRTTDIRFVADKDPRLVEYLPFVKRLFLDATIVHIIRDPRDVLSSKMRADWSKDRDWRLHTLASRIHLEMGVRDGARLFGGRYIQVRYEDLITDAESELRKLCIGLGLEYASSMLEYTNAARILTADDEYSWKKETFDSLKNDNFNKWMRTLSQKQIRFCEAAHTNWIERFGYHRAGESGFVFGTIALMISILSIVYRVYARTRNFFMWRIHR